MQFRGPSEQAGIISWWANEQILEPAGAIPLYGVETDPGADDLNVNAWVRSAERPSEGDGGARTGEVLGDCLTAIQADDPPA